MALLGSCKLDEGDNAAAERNKTQNLGTTPAPVISEGPAPIAPINWSGAVERIVLDPSSPTGLHAATVGGGMFVTADYTASPASWVATTDTMPSLAMGDVAVDPTDDQHLVAATGCSSANAWYCGRAADGASRPVNGLLYESNDGGSSWSAPIVDPALKDKTIQAVTVRDDIVLVATGRGGSGDIVRGSGSMGSRT